MDILMQCQIRARLVGDGVLEFVPLREARSRDVIYQSSLFFYVRFAVALSVTLSL